MLHSNEENFFRTRAEGYIKSRETTDPACLKAKLLQRRSSIEAMTQRYRTMQRFTTDNNALHIARKSNGRIASVENTSLVSQYRKVELIEKERAAKAASMSFEPRTMDIESLRKRYNIVPMVKSVSPLKNSSLQFLQNCKPPAG